MPSSTFVSEMSLEKGYGAKEVITIIHASVIARVNGVQARLMVDTGAGSSYICTDVITKVDTKPCRVERRVIKQSPVPWKMFT